MSDNRNDFDFDDDFFQDDDDQFDFGGDEEDLPAGLGEDTFDEDMPVLEEEPEERGGSRAFIVLAVLMILLFLGGLALVLFLILRPTGPSDLELTATQVVLLNQTVEAQLAQTQTQAREFEVLTLTAAAFTDTPAPTATDTPVTREPTRTPTATLDPTDLAATALALSFAQTATALAQPTATPTNTPEPVGIRENFATEVAFATAQGVFQANMFATQVAFATLIAEATDEPGSDTELLQSIAATQSALGEQIGMVATAIGAVNEGFATLAVANLPIATQLAGATPANAETQAALVTPQILATLAAVETQAFFATQIADAADVSGPALEATQAAFATPPFFSTQAAVATQVALATRSVLVEIASGGAVVLAPTTVPTSALEAVNQTATAIAGAFLTATAQAGGIQPTVEPGVTGTTVPVTPGFTPVATALPDTGLFDALGTGGSDGIGLLALAVVGLVGVIFISRRIRTMNNKPTPPENPPEG